MRALDGLPVFRPLGCVQKHASIRRALCTRSQPRPFEVVLSSSFSFRIRSPGSCRVSILGLPWRSQARAETRLRMGWACAACTFVNNAGSACGVCSEPASGAPSSGDAKWTCDACTFVNMGETAFCEICDTGRPALNQASSVPSALGISVLGTSFRPLRASARLDSEADRAGEDAPIMIVDSPEAECIVTGHRGVGEPGPQVVSGSTNPRSKKRRAQEAALIDLSESKSEGDVPDVKDGKRKKESEEEPNHLLKNLHKERIARIKAGAPGLGSPYVKPKKSSSDVKQEKGLISESSGFSDIQKGKGVISLSSLSREQKLAYIEAEGTWLEKPSSELTVMSYNVWFREDLELQARLTAIGDVILQHRPHIVFFQEVTENIYNIFQRASWWKSYDCSVKPGVGAQRAYFCMQLSKLPVLSSRQSPFRNSVMGRELCFAELDAGEGARLLVATSHLESPCPAPPTWNQMFSPERVAQANEAMSILKEFPNVIFGGDMNWDDKKDGPPPLPSGWIDAWLHLRPGQDGFTYDTKANRMLSGQRSLQKRLDRMFCQLQDFEAVSIEMVGTEPISGVTYVKEKKVKGQVQMLNLPVLPSDHFGLLLKLRRKSA